MVEVSPALRQKQWQTLRCENGATGSDAREPDPRPLRASAADQEGEDVLKADNARREGVSGFGNVRVCPLNPKPEPEP